MRCSVCVPASVRTFVISVALSRLTPERFIAASRRALIRRSSLTVTVPALPAAKRRALAMPRRSALRLSIRSSELTRHALAHVTRSFSPRLITRWTLTVRATVIRDEAALSPATPPVATLRAAATVTTTDAVAVRPPGSLTVSVAV